MEDILSQLIEQPEYISYIAIFTMLIICGLGVPIPEDIILISGGALCYYGTASVPGMILTGMAGVLIGDSAIFLIGQKYGYRIARVWPFNKFLTEERLRIASEKLREKGNKLVFAARFMPGLRMPIYFTSATLGLPYRTFFICDGSAALLSVPAIVIAADYFGNELDHVIKLIRATEHGIFGVIVLTILVFFIKWYINKRKEKVS